MKKFLYFQLMGLSSSIKVYNYATASEELGTVASAAAEILLDYSDRANGDMNKVIALTSL